MSLNFGLIGAAGYIAPRHMKAISETENELVVAFDPNDSVGIIDSYFPKADFFVEFERFDRHVDKLRRRGRPLNYLSICSPNYLHDAHVRFALRNHCNAICEKPLVLSPWNIEGLQELERETGSKVANILQLRLHPSIIKLRNMVQNSSPSKVFDVDLTYLTSRGRWYDISWKGDLAKSGGLATNIGIHFFDMLQWVFGDVKENVVNIHRADVSAGLLSFRRANVRWFLSVNSDFLPTQAKEGGKSTYRSVVIEGEEFEFSTGFTDLHTLSYQHILETGGFGLREAQASVDMAHDIRNANPVGLIGEYHPLCKVVS